MHDIFYGGCQHESRSETYSGEIRLEDFDTERETRGADRYSHIAYRIVADSYFDRKCKSNIEARERRRLYGERVRET